MKNKWNYDKCKEIALKFKTRKALKEAYYQVHYKIYKKRWYELLAHMERQASKASRCVYYYKFKTNAIYVGLTCNHKRRDIQHRQCGPIYEYSVKNTESIPEMILLTDYIDYNDAAKIESEIIDFLSKSNKNIILLNKECGGGLGSWASEKVTKEKCVEDIRKCSNKTELKQKYYSSYLYLLNNLDDMEEEFQTFFKKNSRYRKIICFTENGEYYKEFDKIEDAKLECKTKNVSEACREHYCTNGFYFMYYDEWVSKGKPLKILSKEENSKVAHKNTIIHRNENYAKNGNPQKGKKRGVEYRKKISIPIVITDLGNNFIDVLPGISFAIEKYGITEKIRKYISKVRDNPLKSAYGYRWYTIDYYNKTFNKNIHL